MPRSAAAEPPTTTPPLSGRRAEAARNDGVILRAAREVFLDDPSAPIAAVAERAGVGIGALYRRYPSKDALLQRAAQTTAEAMPRLRTMKDLSDYWIEVNRIENEADKLYRRLLSRLYSGEFDALEILKLKEVADQLEEAADAFEHVANVVETIAVKES